MTTLVKKSIPVVRNRLLYFFGPPARFAAGAMVIAGILGFFLGGPAALLLIVIGLTMITAHSGIELYGKEKRYRLYYKILGLIKWGRMRNLGGYNHLIIRPWRGSYTVYSRSNRRLDLPARKYVLYAVGNSRYKKIPLFMADDRDAVYQKGEEIRLKTNMEWSRKQD